MTTRMISQKMCIYNSIFLFLTLKPQPYEIVYWDGRNLVEQFWPPGMDWVQSMRQHCIRLFSYWSSVRFNFFLLILHIRMALLKLKATCDFYLYWKNPVKNWWKQHPKMCQNCYRKLWVTSVWYGLILTTTIQGKLDVVLHISSEVVV